MLEASSDHAVVQSLPGWAYAWRPTRPASCRPPEASWATPCSPCCRTSSRFTPSSSPFSSNLYVQRRNTSSASLMRHQVFLTKLWLHPTYKSFVTALTLCGYTSYMFGWHVHEKAILLVLVPLRSVS
jgi:hypothetical protein